MSDRTPLEKLDDAIHEFLAETDDGGKAITGWVVGMSTSRIQVEDDEYLPRVTGQSYALGPQTSMTDAAGIVQFTGVVLEREFWASLADGDQSSG